MYDNLGRRPNVNFLREHLFREGRVTEGQALYLLEEATKLLRNEQNMLEVQGPITGEYVGLYFRTLGREAEQDEVSILFLHTPFVRT